MPTGIDCARSAVLVLAPGLPQLTEQAPQSPVEGGQGRHKRMDETGRVPAWSAWPCPGRPEVRKATLGDTGGTEEPGPWGSPQRETEAGSQSRAGQEVGSGGQAVSGGGLDSVLSVAGGMILAAQGPLGATAGHPEKAWQLR